MIAVVRHPYWLLSGEGVSVAVVVGGSADLGLLSLYIEVATIVASGVVVVVVIVAVVVIVVVVVVAVVVVVVVAVVASGVTIFFFFNECLCALISEKRQNAR